MDLPAFLPSPAFPHRARPCPHPRRLPPPSPLPSASALARSPSLRPRARASILPRAPSPARAPAGADAAPTRRREKARPRPWPRGRGAEGAEGAGELARTTKRAVVVLADFHCDLIVFHIISRLNSLRDVAAVAVGLLAAYLLADLVSGLVHFISYAYFPPAAAIAPPPAGARAAQEDFFSTVFPNCRNAIPLLAIVVGLELNSPSVPLEGASFLVAFLSLLAILPQLRIWSRDRSPPVIVRVLQAVRVLYRERPAVWSAGGIIKSAWPESGECGVSGWCNGAMRRWRLYSRVVDAVYIVSGGRVVPWRWREARERLEALDDTGT